MPQIFDVLRDGDCLLHTHAISQLFNIGFLGDTSHIKPGNDNYKKLFHNIYTLFPQYKLTQQNNSIDIPKHYQTLYRRLNKDFKAGGLFTYQKIMAYGLRHLLKDVANSNPIFREKYISQLNKQLMLIIEFCYSENSTTLLHQSMLEFSASECILAYMLQLNSLSNSVEEMQKAAGKWFREEGYNYYLFEENHGIAEKGVFLSKIDSMALSELFGYTVIHGRIGTVESNTTKGLNSTELAENKEKPYHIIHEGSSPHWLLLTYFSKSRKIPVCNTNYTRIYNQYADTTDCPSSLKLRHKLEDILSQHGSYLDWIISENLRNTVKGMPQQSYANFKKKYHLSKNEFLKNKASKYLTDKLSWYYDWLYCDQERGELKSSESLENKLNDLPSTTNSENLNFDPVDALLNFASQSKGHLNYTPALKLATKICLIQNAPRQQTEKSSTLKLSAKF